MQTGDLLFSKNVMTFVIPSQPITGELSQTLYSLYLQLFTLQKQSKELGLAWSYFLFSPWYSFNSFMLFSDPVKSHLARNLPLSHVNALVNKINCHLALVVHRAS